MGVQTASCTNFAFAQTRLSAEHLAEAKPKTFKLAKDVQTVNTSTSCGYRARLAVEGRARAPEGAPSTAGHTQEVEQWRPDIKVTFRDETNSIGS